jgi:hypothetical protein
MSKTQTNIDEETLLIEDWKTYNKAKAEGIQDTNFTYYYC